MTIETDEPARAATMRRLLDLAAAVERDDPRAATTAAAQARAQAHELGDAAAEAEACLRLGMLADDGGRIDQAFAAAVEARDLARRVGAVTIEALATHLMGSIHGRAGNLGDALANCLHAIELHRSGADRDAEGLMLNTLAGIHHALGDPDRALATYQQASAVNELHARPDLDAVTRANIARLHAEIGDHRHAVELGESALALARAHAPRATAGVLANLGDAYARLGDDERAAACFDEALALLGEGGDADPAAMAGAGARPIAAIAVRTARGKASMRRGAWDEAQADLIVALDIARWHGARPAQLTVHELLAEIHQRQGRFEDALTHQQARFDLHRDLFNQDADLRIRTLQIAHDTERAEQQTQLLRQRADELEALVRGRTDDLEAFQIEAFQRLAVLAEFRDTETGEHTVRVGDMSAEIALELNEDPAWSAQLRLAARLHDIGKVAVPDSILLKPGPLTAEEFDVMRTHTTVGAQILSGSSSPLIQLAAVVALNHHERWDGTGYPNGVAGEEIPRSGRIVTVADVFDALTSERVYKRAWTSEEAEAYIVEGRGAQFQPDVVDAFVRVMARRR